GTRFGRAHRHGGNRRLRGGTGASHPWPPVIGLSPAGTLSRGSDRSGASRARSSRGAGLHFPALARAKGAALAAGMDVPALIAGLLVLDVDYVRTVRRGQVDAHAVGHQLGPGKRVDARIDFKPDRVLLVGIQTLGTENILRPIGLSAADNRNRSIG